MSKFKKKENPALKINTYCTYTNNIETDSNTKQHCCGDGVCFIWVRYGFISAVEASSKRGDAKPENRYW